MKDITIHKDVNAGVTSTATKVSIDNRAVVKGEALSYNLTMDNLPANRATDVKSVKWSDQLPQYVDYAGFKVFDATGKM